MKIRHPKGGEVVGVIESGEKPGWWIKAEGYSMRYFDSEDGWSEVKEPRYVDVTESIVIDSDGDLVVNSEHYVVAPFAHKFHKKRWFDLPENLLHDIHSMTVKGFIEYIQRFKKPCLIVEKEES